jgi:hypothetical protein
LRGLEAPIAVFEPWPPQAGADWRERYLAANQAVCDDPARAADLFEILAGEMPSDPVPSRLAQRLRGPAGS